MAILALLIALSVGGDPFLDAFDRLGVREQQARASDDLVAMGPTVAFRLLRAAIKADEPKRQAIQDVLVRIGLPAAESLWQCSRDARVAEYAECDFAADATARMAGDVAAAAEGWVSSTDPWHREFGIGVLRRLGPKRALAAMQRLTQSHDEHIVRSAYTILGSWKEPGTSDLFTPALESNDGSTKAMALRGLAGLKDRKLIPAALKEAADDRGGMQPAAVAALGEVYDTSLRRPIVRVARHSPFTDARFTASKVLRGLGDPVARSLGVRYGVDSTAPAAQVGFQRRQQLELVGTVLVGLLALGWKGRGPIGPALPSLVFLVGGYLWGNVVSGIDGTVERLLLLFAIPTVWLVNRFVGAGKTLAIDFVVPIAVGIVVSSLAPALVVFLAFSAPAVIGIFAMTLAGYLVVLPLITGIVVALIRVQRRRRGEAFARDPANVRFATMSCCAFYAGYTFGWWKLWGYSTDALWTIF